MDPHFGMDRDSHLVVVVLVYRRDHHRVLVVEVVVRGYIHRLVVLVVAGSFSHSLCRNLHIVLFLVNVRADILSENSLVEEDRDGRKGRPILVVHTDGGSARTIAYIASWTFFLNLGLSRVSKAMD